ncbi:hypothetical protein [Geomesophilobacter sediminis]|uniref:Uncharacterized protein n=1 Tax=Geomesophilobacter sediminis TaxID=2798584 RepID=A0A8J7IPR0_9BACT|nr:hypothetical protein [Geomesophilobacter sediminis]MBJ6725643.1 hypothetical protein [Geomesophilobacter sediminis]
MPNVLLIADSPRLKQIFEAVDGTGILILRSAATLAQAEQEIAVELPAVTFIQSRISGLSVDLVLLHLRKMLPEGARIVVAAADRDELETAGRQQLHSLDLALSDDEVIAAIHDALSGVFTAPSGAAPAAKPAQVTEPGGKDVVEDFVIEDSVRLSTVAPKPDQPDDFVVFSPSHEPQPSRAEEPEPPKVDFQDLLKGKEESSSTYEYPRLTGEFSHAQSLADAMRSAEQERRSSWVVPVAVGAIVLVGVLFFTLRKGSHKEVAKAPAPIVTPAPAPPRAVDVGSLAIKDLEKSPVPAPTTQPPKAAAKGPAQAKGLAPQVPVPLTPAPPVAVAPAKPAPSPLAKTPSTKPAPVPAPPAATAPATKAPKAAPASPATPATPAAPHTGRPVPPIVTAGVLDATYEKKHPGWQKYVSPAAEFKVYREGGNVKALQVIAKGDTIPHALLKRVLKEFAGTEGYRVQTRAVQANFLVERGEAKAGVGVTVYRKKGDQKMRALVLFYR